MKDLIDLSELAQNPHTYISGQALQKTMGITGDLLSSWRKAGLTFYEFGYCSYYYKPKDILDFIESKKRTSPQRSNNPQQKKEKPTPVIKEDRKITIPELEKTPDRLLTTKEMRELLGVSNPTLYRWRKEKLIPCYIIGGVFKYKASDVLQHLNQNQL